MTKYFVEVTQEFSCTYVIEADSPEDAYRLVVEGHEGDCDDQTPGDIVSSFEESSVTEDEA